MGLRIRSEPGEQEGESRVLEKGILSSSTILVQGVANDVEIDKAVLKEVVALVVPVGKDEKLD